MAAAKVIFHSDTTTCQALTDQNGNNLSPYIILDAICDFSGEEESLKGMKLLYSKLDENLVDNGTADKDNAAGKSLALMFYNPDHDGLSNSDNYKNMFTYIKMAGNISEFTETGPAYLAQDGTFKNIVFSARGAASELYEASDFLNLKYVDASNTYAIGMNYNTTYFTAGVNGNTGAKMFTLNNNIKSIADCLPVPNDNNTAKFGLNENDLMFVHSAVTGYEQVRTSRIVTKWAQNLNGPVDANGDLNNALFVDKPMAIVVQGRAAGSLGTINASDRDKSFYFELPQSGAEYRRALVFSASNDSTANSLIWGPAGALLHTIESGDTNPYYLLAHSGIDSPSSSSDITSVDDMYYYNTIYIKSGKLYQSSDETLKDFSEDLADRVELDALATIKKGIFSWKDDPQMIPNVGVTAQSVEVLFPELVTEEHGIKSVEYEKLAVVALAAIDKLNDKIHALEAEIKTLKK